MIRSPFGSAPQDTGQPGALRDDRRQREAQQLRADHRRLLQGVASLFVVVDNTVFPDMMFWTLSLELIIMCLLGGWFSFLGPMVGAGIIVLLRTYVSGLTVYWALILGIIMMLVIFFLPNGVLGYLDRFVKESEKRMMGQGPTCWK